MPRLGSLELRVEVPEGLLQPAAQQPETLGRTRLDQRASQQQIELPARLGRPERGPQPRGITPGLLTLEVNAERDHHLLNLLEVAQLLARKPRQRHGE